MNIKCVVLSLLIIFIKINHCNAMDSFEVQHTKKDARKKDKKRAERGQSSSGSSVNKPVKYQKKDAPLQEEKDSTSPTRQSQKHKETNRLFEKFKNSPRLQEAMTEIAGADIGKLLAACQKGKTEAIVSIGIVSYMLMESRPLRVGDSLDPFEFESVCDDTFAYLSAVENSDDPVAIRLLGLCCLRRPGHENLMKGMQLIKRAGEKSRDTTIALKDEWNIRKRLVLVETGESKYLSDDSSNRKVIDTYADENHLGAICIRANALFKKSPEEAVAILTSLATSQNNALAQWVLGSAYFYGRGVEKNPDFGLHWIFKAAVNKCPAAFLFMNARFSQPPQKIQDDARFNESVRSLYESAESIQKNHNKLSDVKGYESICDFEYRLIEELYALLNLRPGFMVNGFNTDQELLEALQSTKEPTFVYCNKSDLSWGEDNVTKARNLELFLGEVDGLFKNYRVAIDAFIKEVKAKIVDCSIKENALQETVIPKDRREKMKLDAKKERIKEEKESLAEGMKMILDDQGKLADLIKSLKELIPSTYEDRKKEFLKAYDFLKPL